MEERGAGWYWDVVEGDVGGINAERRNLLWQRVRRDW